MGMIMIITTIMIIIITTMISTAVACRVGKGACRGLHVMQSLARLCPRVATAERPIAWQRSRVGKIARAPFPRGKASAGDFAHPTLLALPAALGAFR
jgi:hypothetical protein